MNRGNITKPFQCQKIATQIPNTNHIACALNNSMSSTSSASFAYMNLLPGLQGIVSSTSSASFTYMNLLPGLPGMIGSNKCEVKLAKHFIHQKLSKKVQFLQTGNVELIKKVFTQARKFMKYSSKNS
jgi:hypothetical protein